MAISMFDFLKQKQAVCVHLVPVEDCISAGSRLVRGSSSTYNANPQVMTLLL